MPEYSNDILFSKRHHSFRYSKQFAFDQNVGIISAAFVLVLLRFAVASKRWSCPQTHKLVNLQKETMKNDTESAITDWSMSFGFDLSPL